MVRLFGGLSSTLGRLGLGLGLSLGLGRLFGHCLGVLIIPISVRPSSMDHPQRGNIRGPRTTA